MADTWTTKRMLQSQSCDSSSQPSELFSGGVTFDFRRKPKLTKSRCLYYSNTCASRRLLLLGGDIASNPGPSKQTTKTNNNKDSTDYSRKRSIAPSCLQCDKTVRRNQKHLICEVCKDFTHARCAVSAVICKALRANEPRVWTCPKCSLTEMPFYGQKDLQNTSVLSDCASLPEEDGHLNALHERFKHLKIMHINTQCMVSTCDNLRLVIERFGYDIITMSETWLKDNQLLLDHLAILGYVHAFNHRA